MRVILWTELAYLPMFAYTNIIADLSIVTLSTDTFFVLLFAFDSKSCPIDLLKMQASYIEINVWYKQKMHIRSISRINLVYLYKEKGVEIFNQLGILRKQTPITCPQSHMIQIKVQQGTSKHNSQYYNTKHSII